MPLTNDALLPFTHLVAEGQHTLCPTMVKYGRLLVRARRLSNPTWQAHWLDYHALKGLIYKIKSDNDSTSTKHRESSSDEEVPTTNTPALPVPPTTFAAPTSGTADATAVAAPTSTTTTTTTTTAMPPPSETNPAALSEQSRTFFTFLRTELRKVSTFYNNQETFLLNRTNNFAIELHAAEAQDIDEKDVEQKEARVITLSRLMESCKVLYVDLMMLENFAGTWCSS